MKASILLALSLCSSAFAAVARRTGKVQYAGVNIAGCDFGLQTDVSVLSASSGLKLDGLTLQRVLSMVKLIAPRSKDLVKCRVSKTMAA